MTDVFFYRVYLSFLLPLFLLHLGYRLMRGQETWDDLKQRLGLTPPQEARTIWLHAATENELQAARPVLLSLRRLRPNERFLVTSTTLAGRDLVSSWGLENCDVQLSPIDLAALVRGFLKKNTVRAIITLENDFLLNRMAAADYLKIPTAFLGTRLTARSAERWGRFPIVTNRALQTIRLMAAADADSQDRFVALGLPKPRIAPRIELRALYAPEDLATDDSVAAAFPFSATWLAASTHPDEEQVILEAHKLARRQLPGLKLILVPRNPKRAPEVAGQVSVAGLSQARRTSGAVPTPGTDVYIADTYGELPRWYAMAPVTFVGGSLVDVGGHSPFKPMIHGTALIHGPYVGNHRSIYALLDQARAAQRVTDAASLAQAVVSLFDPETREDQLARTRSIPSEEQALEKILARFSELL